MAKKKRPRVRVYPRVVIRKDVRNQSARAGSIDRIVIHSTESHNRPGSGDIQAIVSWFDNPSAQASSHVIVDAEGQSARIVDDEKKAWTQAQYNSRALSIEQIGFAAQKSWPLEQYRETARWVAYWSLKWGVPIDATHVVTHASLGAAGGGHHDPGPGYDMAKLRRIAKRRAVAMRLRGKPRRKR